MSSINNYQIKISLLDLDHSDDLVYRESLKLLISVSRRKIIKTILNNLIRKKTF